MFEYKLLNITVAYWIKLLLTDCVILFLLQGLLSVIILLIKLYKKKQYLDFQKKKNLIYFLVQYQP